jgi:DNA-directed RNA polymerase specialized sigma24 family protein
VTPAGPNAFPPTRLSVIERIRAADADVRREAFGDIVDAYWRPVYTHLRLTWRLAPEDAQDLTQGFFTGAFEKTWLEAYDASRARFRTFVRVCADRYVMNWKQAATRLKRGGEAVQAGLDFEAAERALHRRAASAPGNPDEVFRQEFIRAVFAKALAAVRADCEARGRPADYAMFERYDVDPADGVSYARLAAEFGLTVAQVTNRLAQVRRSFRERALEALRALSGSDAHYREEAREVFGLEV